MPEAQEPRAALPRTVAAIERGLRDGMHIGAQVYASLGGEPRADFAHALAVAIVFNGMPSDAAHAARMRATLDALYEDLVG